MIYKSSSPLSPAVTIRIGGVQVNYTSIYGAELVLEENKHDLLILKLMGVPPELLNTYINAPVLFKIDSGPYRNQLFTGYASNIEPVGQSNLGYVNNSPFQEVHVYCIGASYYMKSMSSKVWNPPTLTNVINELSKKYGFSADYPKSKYVPINLTQTAESDWSFITKAVNKYSFRVTVHGTHIHVWDTYNATGRASSYHELITPKNPNAALPCTILKFEGFFGSLSSSGYSSSTSVAYLDNQGQTLQVSSSTLRETSGLGTRFASGFDNLVPSSTQSFEEAQRELLRVRKSNMPFSASIQITAGAGIVPGGIVNVTNYGSSFDGLWYVKSVKHSVYQNHYLTNLEVSKDAIHTTDYDIKPVTKFKEPPEPTIIGDRWVASKRKVSEYV